MGYFYEQREWVIAPRLVRRGLSWRGRLTALISVAIYRIRGGDVREQRRSDGWRPIV